MKNLFLAVLLLVGVLGACKKAELFPVQPTVPILVLSPNGGEYLVAGQAFTIDWKSYNLPKNSLILAWLVAKAPDGTSQITVLWPKSGGTSIGAVPDNGHNTFMMTPDTGNYDGWNMYHSGTTYGNNYRVLLQAVIPDTKNIGNWIDPQLDGVFIGTSKENFSVCPAGTPPGCSCNTGG